VVSGDEIASLEGYPFAVFVRECGIACKEGSCVSDECNRLRKNVKRKKLESGRVMSGSSVFRSAFKVRVRGQQ